jgi:hypothetical protein
MFANDGETVQKAKILILVAVLTAIFNLAAFLIPGINTI